MKKGYIIAVVIVAVLVVAGLIYFYSISNSYRQSLNTQPNVRPSESPAANNTAPAEATVTYTDSGFSPSTVTISKGGTVVFKNAASDDMRVASNPHPVHNGYPTTGGCVGSTFDSCANIPPGGSWSFTFTFTGSWGYHNHLNPSEGGTVIVK